MEKPKEILELEDYWGIEINENDFVINEINQIIELDLSSNQIRNLRPLKKLNYLETLCLKDNEISNINVIKDLKNLKSLDLSINYISNLNPISGLLNLTYLNLSHNNHLDISPLKDISSLIMLYLTDNRISDLRPLKNLTKLITLYLTDNEITDLNPLKELNQLKRLFLSKNLLTNLNGLQKLKRLKTLDLRNNHINDLRPIEYLISKTRISYWPQNEENTINIYNNPLGIPPIEVVKQGNKSVINWFEKYEVEESKGIRPLNEAKMVIIGEPDAGKTTLMNYLLGKPFTETKTTQGIKIEPWEITDEAGTPYRINIWDFGGQEIQSTVHRFFLTQDTLYVVLLNARKDEKPDKYLEQIRSYAPNSPVLIVINRMDENYGSVDESRLIEEYRAPSGERLIKGIYKTSIRKAHEFNDPYFLPGVQELEAGIVRELLTMPNLRQTVPSNYFEVKNYLESRFFKDEPYITHERYEAICREKNLETASDEALLMILDRLGTVRYFDERHTRHLHILNPEWLSDGVYRILTDKHTHDLQGVITEKDFSRILYKTDAHTFSYPKQHYGYLIEMIRRFYLGYINPDTHEIFIPQAFKSDYPAGFRPEDFKTDALHFFFRYETFIPAGAISSFIARTFGRVRGHLYWQKGIVIEQRELEEVQTALVMQTDTRNRIDIWVQGTHRREFFIAIRQIFREFHERYPGLKVDEMIGLDAKRDTAVKYRVLIAHKHKGKTEYTDEEGNDYNIDRLLGMFESPAATQQAIVQNFQGSYYDMRGVKQVQFIQIEAQSIAEELAKFHQSAGEQNQAILNQLITDLKELQKAETPKKAKGVLAQLKETVKNLPKIASEEAVKWATKTTLDGVPFSEKFDSLKERLLNLLQDSSFQDFITSPPGPLS